MNLKNVCSKSDKFSKEHNKKGKIRKGVTADFAADVLMNTLHGVRVNSRDGKSPKQLGDMIKFTLDSLSKK